MVEYSVWSQLRAPVESKGFFLLDIVEMNVVDLIDAKTSNDW
jgi:hypothetical protein